MSEPLLQLQGIDAGYGGRRVLHGVSLSLPPGEIVALVGPNGAGKSTLLKAVFGIVTTTRGTIVYRGREIQNQKASDNVRNGLSYLVQGSRVFPGLSVRDNLEVGGHTLPTSEVEIRVQEVLALFPGLLPLQTRNAAALSTGEKQMLAVARALMLKPALLLADEPSLGLGPQLAHVALTRLRELRRRLGTSVLLVEQNVREALAIADRVYVLKLGEIVLTGEPTNLTPEALRRAFLA